MSKSERHMLQAAYLASTGKSVEEIATVLGKEDGNTRPAISTVYRWLKDAVSKGWLGIDKKYRLIPAEIPRELYLQVVPADPCEDLKDKLLDKLREVASQHGHGVAPGISLVRSESRETDPASWDTRGREVAREAAKRFASMADKVNSLGVMWGKTLRSWVDHLAQDRVRLPFAQHCVPLCPEPSFSEETTPYTHLASTLAADLVKTTCPQATHYELPIFASIPGDFTPTQCELIRQLVQKIAAYRKVFGDGGGKLGLANQVDVVVTSCGAATEEFTDPWLTHRLIAEGWTKKEWHKHIVGDLGGTLFPKDGGMSSKEVKDINDRWLGCKKIHLKKCADSAARSKGKRIGVFVIAHGKSKAAVLAQAIRENCLNELVCDDDLGAELLRQL